MITALSAFVFACSCSPRGDGLASVVAQEPDDVVAIHHQMVTGLVEAGCPYVQLDEPSYTGYVDPDSLDHMTARGHDPLANLNAAIDASNGAIAGLGGRAVFGLHICRGNRASMWHREGHYDAIAEAVFGRLRFDRLLLEYDTERAGRFEPLRYVPKDTMVGLGLVTTKTGEVETVDELVARIEEVQAHVLPVLRATPNASACRQPCLW